MASEDTTNMFGDLKKKKKKPKVAFAEEPASVDADPTYPPKEPVHDELLGPKTAHEKQAQVDHDANKENEDAENMFGDLKKRKKKKEVVIDDDAVEEVGADELDFSDIKRKKKKKPIPDNLEETPAPPADDEPLDDFSDLKKKKKKKRDIPMDLEGGEAPAPAEGGDDFSDLKKKPKKKKVAMEDFERQFVDDDEEPIPKPKKSKKVEEKKVESDEDGAEDDDGEFDEVNEAPEEELGDNPFAAGSGGGGGGGNEAEPWLGSDRDYTYEELLSRFFRVLHASNPALASSSSKRYTLAPPSIHRDGNKKSVFANIGDICRRMHREPSHVISFLLVEMGTTGSVDGSGRLVIKGKFQQKQIENILRRYIVEYVTCKTCKSPDTILTKETRISFITCESCGSRQSVQPIKAGFQAQVGKRKKAVA